MPTVYLTERQRINHRLARWVYGEMKVRRLTQKNIADLMGITHQALSRKLRCASFDYTDFVFFVKQFQPSDRELKEIIGV